MSIQDDVNRSLEALNKEIDEAIGKATPEQVVVIQKKLVLDLLTRLVKKTPVDTGRARGNWQVSITEFPDTFVEVTDKDGGSTIDEGLAELTNLQPYALVYITNNVPYILYLEGGHSGQAPEGMVAVSLSELAETITP